ncbi:transcriptional regulator, AraC family protein [Roseobacter sp. SK209-2-6]|uniref:GlxA family transcriptional regulator n=1 Tax=Roseobacter sp. SK209-2-6 TaxID=388739 RepID=UPI0000F3EEF6|nr:helix-turn-helix domain-containing protein [Roseobacter sp. SK209-2-6]EBA16835.1 transcriptional regulator, AraC family protein [Roseobacter sp. SK209-2-6]
MLNVRFILFPEFQMLAYVLATETLRLGNKTAGQEVFSWQVLTATDAPVAASNGGMVSPDSQDWSVESAPDLVLLCAGYNPRRHISARLKSYLARIRRRGCVIGGVDTGTVILAELGLLDGVRAVLHYEAEADFRESWPGVSLVDQIYSLDRKRLTAAGGTATGDAMLAWVGQEKGADFAAAVAEAMSHGRIRKGEEPQRNRAQEDPILRQMETLMQENLAQPLPVTALCQALGHSNKQLRLRCQRGLGRTPSAHYLALRLEQAGHLMAQTLMPATEVALACGFGSAAGFSRAFRQHFGISPRQMRQGQARR